MSFLKLLFWIFLIYLIIRFVRFSFYFGKISNQVRKNYQSPQEEETKKEGTTTIKYIPEKDNKSTSTSSRDDDYIDYEEVK